jgi:thiol:disulfide interchange protein
MLKTIVGFVILVAAVTTVLVGPEMYRSWRGTQALQATGLQFLTLDAALAESRTRSKPVFVDYTAKWCGTCRAMHNRVFTDARVREAIARGYVLALVDYESPEADAFRKRYDAEHTPTLLVLDGSGNLIRRLDVTLDPQVFLAELGG